MDIPSLKILVVDDDFRSRDVAVTCLRKLGCDRPADEAESGIRAFDLASKNEYDVALMDEAMEPINGRETAFGIGQIYGIPSVYVTGNAKLVHDDARRAGIPIVEKPSYTEKDLRKAIEVSIRDAKDRSIDDPIRIAVNPEGFVLSINSRAHETLCMSVGEARGKSLASLMSEESQVNIADLIAHAFNKSELLETENAFAISGNRNSEKSILRFENVRIIQPSKTPVVGAVFELSEICAKYTCHIHRMRDNSSIATVVMRADVLQGVEQTEPESYIATFSASRLAKANLLEDDEFNLEISKLGTRTTLTLRQIKAREVLDDDRLESAMKQMEAPYDRFDDE